jgi:hypothetical protein
VVRRDSSGPTAEDAARRLIVLKYVVGHSIVVPPRDLLAQLLQQWSEEDRRRFIDEAETMRDQFWDALRGADLWSSLSPAELDYARATAITMTDQQRLNASWRMEAVQTLMWALGLIGKLPPWDTEANHELLKTIPSGDISSFISAATLRDRSEIDRAREAAELWHWRSRTRQLIENGDVFQPDDQMRSMGLNTYDDIVRLTATKAAEDGLIPLSIDDDFPAMGKAYRDLTNDEWSQVRSITMERHFTLNWLCGRAPGNRWDETPTDT